MSTIVRPARASPSTSEALTTPPVRKGHVLASLEPTALASVGNAEARRFLDVEPSRPRFLDQPVADGGDTVVDGEAVDRVAVSLQPGPWLELHGCDGVGETPEDPLERREELVEPTRAVDRERKLAAAERERLEHSREPEVVIGVVVGQEDLREIDEADVATQQLPLRALRAVEEEPVAPSAHECRTGRAFRRRHGARRPEEDDVQFHGERF